MSGTMRRTRIGAAAVGLVCIGAVAALAAPEAKPILGFWQGTSTCVNLEAAPACNNEVVIYEFTETAPPSADKVTCKADKIVDGKRQFMGELEFVRGAAPGVWISEFENRSGQRGVWTFTVQKDDLSGTLVRLPEKTLIRKIAVKRIPPPKS